jgi:hypothetical protein
MASYRRRAAVVTAMIPLAFSTTAAALLRAPKVSDKDPKPIQLTVVTVVEVASSVGRRAAKDFREYLTHKRPVHFSAFGCFKLVGAKSMRDAKTIARQEGARFILRVQLLRHVVVDRLRDAHTGKMGALYNSDVKLECWVPATYRGAPANSWKAKSSCMARNYNPKSPGLALIGGGMCDDTDKPDTLFEFGMLGNKIIAYLQRSVLELKKVTVERAPDGSESARIEVVNHAHIPVDSFNVSLGSGLCWARYRGKPLPPGGHTVTVPFTPARLRADDEKVPANGTYKGTVRTLSFGWAKGSAAEKDAAAGKRKGKP